MSDTYEATALFLRQRVLILQAQLADLEAERTLIVQRAENAEAALVETASDLDAACRGHDAAHAACERLTAENAAMRERLAEAERQNADLMEIIDKRDEALGFIPLDNGMDMQDEILEAKGKLVQAVAIVRDLTRQITEFCEREGEADFYTGVAIEFLEKSEPCNHVWSKRLRGRDTCAICGVARPTDRINAALQEPKP